MVLGFSTKFPDGTPTGFPEKILAGTKIHTFRLGHRWAAGKSIQMATGVRTKAYNQFNRERPDLCVVESVQNFHIAVDKNEELYLLIDGKFRMPLYEAGTLTNTIARNDGFETGQELFNWFRPKGQLRADFELHGQIIHWTDLRY